jgi:flagellar hook assembly protein FlgD
VSEVSLYVLDLAGDMVCRIVNKRNAAAGVHSAAWYGANVSGAFAGAGTYVYVFSCTDAVTGKTKVIRKPVGLMR